MKISKLLSPFRDLFGTATIPDDESPLLHFPRIVRDVRPRTLVFAGRWSKQEIAWMTSVARGQRRCCLIFHLKKRGAAAGWIRIGPTLLVLREDSSVPLDFNSTDRLERLALRADAICVVGANPGSSAVEEAPVPRWSGWVGKLLNHHLISWTAERYGTLPSNPRIVVFRNPGLNDLDASDGAVSADVAVHIRNQAFPEALRLLDQVKARLRPPRGTDYLRAYCFWKLGRGHDALEAAKEEIRWHPDHGHAKRLAEHLLAALFPPPTLGNAEFKELYGVIRPYTMLSEARLHSLYDLARKTCLADVPGDFAECGVAGGGSSALLAAVIARHSRHPRRVFACDTFTGMPAPTEKDVHADLHADQSGWGTGTCSAPTASLEEVSRKLGVFERIVPVQGLFAETLPGLGAQTESIAFLHMDGDWYESTRDILVNLYDRVAPGALIQVDDYGYWQGCRDAIHQFESERSLSFSLNRIDGTGVWFRKPGVSGSQRLLNVGCGKRFHPDWLNLDLVPAEACVIRHDLAEPLPLDDGTCSVVYHSHVLEHLPRGTARIFLEECFRVLAPEGVLRIAVPDLEMIARLYLENLSSAVDGSAEAKQRLEWMTIELVDQLARHRSGGEMLAYWQRNPMPAEDFVISRMGDEVKRFLEHQRAASATVSPQVPAHPDAVGKFRLGGEVHQWMYDRVSLSDLLLACGFTDPRVRSATDSSIPGFTDYHLDADEAGRPRKPDSLYLEARKPSPA